MLLSVWSNVQTTVLCGKLSQLGDEYIDAAVSVEKTQGIMADLGPFELSTPVRNSGFPFVSFLISPGKPGKSVWLEDIELTLKPMLVGLANASPKMRLLRTASWSLSLLF